MEQYKAVIFDMDGTLLDSMWIWKSIDCEYLGRFGIKIPANLQSEIEGKSFNETAIYFKEHFNIHDSVEQIKNTWNNMAYDFYENKVTLKPGAMEFIHMLHKKGIKMGIATSNSRKLAECALRARGILEYFEAVVTGNDVKYGKPNPEIYLKTSELLNVNPKNCAVFEDIPNGILAGKNAGMTTYAVEDEFSIKLKDKKIELADYYIKDYYELM